MNPLMGHVVSCKKLKDEDFTHIQGHGGLLTCCMEDNGEEHFRTFGSSASGSHDNHMSFYKLVRQIRARSKEEAF